MINYQHDEEADALYVTLSEKGYAYGEELDPERRIDYAEDGTPVGVELLCVSTGVDLRDIPESREIAKLLAEKRIRVLAS
jgi:uncharacterized protein YuzE